jgi:hypothetical protein
MTAINTGTIDPNYPEPGKNNNSQGFRNNFASIKNNIDQAAIEISELQSLSVLKSALSGEVLNNDMSGSGISNATIVGFRHKTFNIGSDLSSSVAIDVRKADVQYGVLSSGNLAIGFKNWSPEGTQSSVELVLTVVSVDSVITLPASVNLGAITLPGYYGSGTGGVLKSFAGIMHLRFTTRDCGVNIEAETINRPRKAEETMTRTPTQIGQPGDHHGMICADSSYVYVCTGVYDGASPIWKRSPLGW